MRGFATAEGRDAKAAKIDAVLCAATHQDALSGLDILDFGAGSGHIAACLARHNRVTAADIAMQLQVDAPNLRFVSLSGTNLPFGDHAYDIVICNFVLMYVPDPILTLKEVHRVLRPGGSCYIALPNRFFPIDPHLHLPLVSYLPDRTYERLVNRLRRTDERIRLFDPRRARRLFVQTGFQVRDYTCEVLNAPERFHVALPMRFPAWRWLSWLAPSNLYVLGTPTAR